MEDARRAAAALAERGAVRVLLYGSVARGEASPDSDIDLVAVFADLGDYSCRGPLQEELRMSASAASGGPVDVFATDLPEWRTRTQAVTSSFESDIVADVVELCRVDKHLPPDWRKRIGMPASNLEEAARQLEAANANSQDVIQRFVPGMNETGDREEGRRLNRMLSMCGDAARTVETSLKTFVALQGTRPKPTHDLNVLLGQIQDETLRRSLRGMLQSQGLSLAAISSWHKTSNYPDDRAVEWDRAERHKTALINLAGGCLKAARDAYARQAEADHFLLADVDQNLSTIQDHAVQATDTVPLFADLREHPPSLLSEDDLDRMPATGNSVRRSGKRRRSRPDTRQHETCGERTAEGQRCQNPVTGAGQRCHLHADTQPRRRQRKRPQRRDRRKR